MNSVRLSLGKNMAVLRFGEYEGKLYASLANDGPDNLLFYGEMGKRQQEATVEDEEPLLVPMAAKGFTAYWTVKNHGEAEIFRITVDRRTNMLALARLTDLEAPTADDAWTNVAEINLAIVPDPEFKIYNYRSTVAVKPLNLPRRPRGRPRKPVADVTDSA
jgi:hypothetical protein